MAAKKKTIVSKGKRYTEAEKQKILSFVENHGRGGQSAAATKFGVSPLTISNWRKAAGGKAKATPKKAGLSLDQVKALLGNKEAAKVVTEIEKLEKAVADAQAKLDAANAKLAAIIK